MFLTLSGELYDYTSPFFRSLHYNVLVLDFKNPELTNCYNFLEEVIKAVNNNDYAKAENIADDIVASLVGESKNGERIWNDGERAVLKCGILAVVIENRNNYKYQNLANVYNFIAKTCQELPNGKLRIDEFLESLPTTHPAVKAFQPALLAPQRTRASFFTSVLSTLNIFTNPYTANMTSRTDIDLASIGSKPTIIYLILNDEKLTQYRICSLFVNLLYVKLVEIADNRRWSSCQSYEFHS